MVLGFSPLFSCVGFCHSVDSKKAGCIGSSVLRIGMATKFIFALGPQGFHEFVCDLERLDLTYSGECTTKIIENGEENQALMDKVMAPFVQYKEVCCLTIGMSYKSSL